MPSSRPRASKAQRSEVTTLMARPTPAIAATGSTAPEKRTAGKQSSGSANVAWDGSVTAAEASRPRVKATTASTSSATVSAT